MNGERRTPACLALAALVASILAACSPTSDRCLPAQLSASPASVQPGQSFRLASAPAHCDLGFDGGTTYTVVLFSSTSQKSEPVGVAVGDDGAFSSDIRVPESFVPGIASVTVKGSPHDDCLDNAGSCALYAVDVTVAP